MNNQEVRERLQALLAQIEDEQMRKRIWDLFKEMKTPEVKTEIVRVKDETTETELRQELALLKERLQQQAFQLEQGKLAEEQLEQQVAWLEENNLGLAKELGKGFDKSSFRALLDEVLSFGEYWIFFVFTPQRGDRLQDLLRGVEPPLDAGDVYHVYVPPGILWTKEECQFVAIPKAKLPADQLRAGLRQHLGYEYPSVHSNIFTLGIKPEDDTAMDKPGFDYFADADDDA
jgi:hypothetical protein